MIDRRGNLRISTKRSIKKRDGRIKLAEGW
jgi:hypothetical protein